MCTRNTSEFSLLKEALLLSTTVSLPNEVQFCAWRLLCSSARSRSADMWRLLVTAVLVGVGVAAEDLLDVHVAPAVRGTRSALYEVYMRPYSYAVGGVTAVARLNSEGESSVSGDMMMLQPQPPAGPVLVTGNLTGLAPGKYVLRLSTWGDLREGCKSAGPPFNPFQAPPGTPLYRAGDLGAVEAGDSGVVSVNLVEPLLPLAGSPRAMVGRSLQLVKADKRDEPLACGIIALAEPPDPEDLHSDGHLRLLLPPLA